MFFVRFRMRTVLEHSPHFILKFFQEVDVLIHSDFGLPYMEGFHGAYRAAPSLSWTLDTFVFVGPLLPKKYI